PEGPSDAPAGDTPLLLIQGLGYTADMWHRVLPGLSGPRRTIRMDNRGVGRSSVPEPPWSIEDFVTDAINVLDDADVDRVHVFGASMGGLIAQELAIRHPDRVDRLVLGCTHPGGSDAVRMDPAAATMLMDRTPKSAREAIEASIPFIYAAETSRDDIERDISARVRYALRATSYWGQLDAMRSHSGTLSRLADITAPTLVVHGTADKLVQPGNAELIAKAIPDARLEWLEGAGHVFWTDQPQRSVDVVNEFLAGGPIQV
ncbi:MAG: alpha/beta fold hydrolase, partial [Frankiaceae bacterium]|nr:alpha/beta fold hydrolase [Frankiaceae bacterium]